LADNAVNADTLAIRKVEEKRMKSPSGSHIDLGPIEESGTIKLRR
jgi:hypothetical protein